MENNIIPLSETKDYKYIGIPVPRDASNFKIMDARTQYSVDLWFDSKFEKFIPIGEGRRLYYSEIEIIGILGETLTEEQAREIMIPFRCFTQLGTMYRLDKMYSSPFAALESLIESKGVKVKNPFGAEPDECDFKTYPLPICFDPYEEQKALYGRKKKIERDWELAEAEVNRVVIIKIKK